MAAQLYYEDLETESVFTTRPRTVTEDDLLTFARVSGDHHPIHVDEAYAATTEFGRRIAHGPLGIAMAIGLFGTLDQFKRSAIVMVDIQDWRFRLPMFIGDEIRLEMTIGDKRLTRSGRGIIDRRFRLLRSDGSVPQEGRSAMVILRRDQATAAS